MPALENPKWEKFAKEVARGKTQRAAYKAIDGKAKDPDSAASDLANNPKVKARIKELTSRVTDKAIERAALTKSWVIESLRANAEKAMKSPYGSSVANRALELLGTELGMFRNDGLPKPPRLEDLPTEDLERMLAESVAANPPPTEPPVTQ